MEFTGKLPSRPIGERFLNVLGLSEPRIDTRHQTACKAEEMNMNMNGIEWITMLTLAVASGVGLLLLIRDVRKTEDVSDHLSGF
jgi:hypothetical protein